MEQPHKTLNTFDEAWEHFEELGIPIEEISKEEYDKLMNDLIEVDIDKLI